MAEWDIHGYEKRLERAKRRLARLDVPTENQQLILAFDRYCILQRLSVARREKLMRHLADLASTLLPVRFDRATKSDIQDAIARIEGQHWTLWTKHDVKVALRRFFKWLVQGDEAAARADYPDLVAWIHPSLKKKDKCVVKASDLVTREDVDRLIEATAHPRDRAMIGLLYELGARIGEIGGLHVGDIGRDDYSLLVDLDGKTGKRTVRVVLYASPVVAWLNMHPLRNDPRAPLWPILRGRRSGLALSYAEFSKVVREAQRRAGIKKRVHPHLFRHSRVTHLLAAGQLNEAQAKVFFGWVPDSSILATYAHLVTKDANDAVLRMYGIQKPDAAIESAQPCGMCKAPNPRTAAFCYRCGYALSLRAAENVQERTRASEETLLRFLQTTEVRELFKKWSASPSGTAGTHSEIPEPTPPPPAPTSATEHRQRKAA